MQARQVQITIEQSDCTPKSDLGGSMRPQENDQWLSNFHDQCEKRRRMSSGDTTADSGDEVEIYVTGLVKFQHDPVALAKEEARLRNQFLCRKAESLINLRKSRANEAASVQNIYK